MFNSLKTWLNLDATRKPFVSRSGSGSKVFGTEIPFKCYAEGKVEVVKNGEGKEVVSNKQLYVDGAFTLNVRDVIVFEGEEHDIQSIGYFYKGAAIDLKVVYL